MLTNKIGSSLEKPGSGRGFTVASNAGIATIAPPGGYNEGPQNIFRVPVVFIGVYVIAMEITAVCWDVCESVS